MQNVFKIKNNKLLSLVFVLGLGFGLNINSMGSDDKNPLGKMDHAGMVVAWEEGQRIAVVNTAAIYALEMLLNQPGEVARIMPKEFADFQTGLAKQVEEAKSD